MDLTNLNGFDLANKSVLTKANSKKFVFNKIKLSRIYSLITQFNMIPQKSDSKFISIIF